MQSEQLVKLAEEFGTPLFVYDADKITQQYKRLVNAFASIDLELHYACKALSNQAILQHICSLGAGLDTVSIEEVHLGLKAGYLPVEFQLTHLPWRCLLEKCQHRLTCY